MTAILDVSVKKTVRIELGNGYDETIEIDFSNGVVTGRLCDEDADFTTNKVAHQGEYLRGLASMFSAAAELWEAGE